MSSYLKTDAVRLVHEYESGMLVYLLYSWGRQTGRLGLAERRR